MERSHRGFVNRTMTAGADLLGCLQGELLEWAEAEELVLSVLSGLLREQTRSMLTVLWHASQSALPLHLRGDRHK